ncbi:hypothetical protein L6452_15229 [Arctium lappa]|uniref:Uncharacterized protein n=1 Tax=Arctium lappa TaxID=4217 RepID=A0ACB9CN17_ARCLA|nr:hypothetical protein L6452_15229 [Arctium lappa]
MGQGGQLDSDGFKLVTNRKHSNNFKSMKPLAQVSQHTVVGSTSGVKDQGVIPVPVPIQSDKTIYDNEDIPKNVEEIVKLVEQPKDVTVTETEVLVSQSKVVEVMETGKQGDIPKVGDEMGTHLQQSKVASSSGVVNTQQNVEKPDVVPPVGLTDRTSKGEILTYVRKAFTTARQGTFTSAPFSVLEKVNEEGDLVHGLHDESFYVASDEITESHVPDVLGTTPQTSS